MSRQTCLRLSSSHLATSRMSPRYLPLIVGGVGPMDVHDVDAHGFVPRNRKCSIIVKKAYLRAVRRKIDVRLAKLGSSSEGGLLGSIQVQHEDVHVVALPSLHINLVVA